MNKFKKILSLGLSAVLSLSAVILPASAADIKYPQPSGTDPAAWYLYGDIDQNGKVNSSDARQILRTAAYLDAQPAEDSIVYGAADYDRDGSLTSRDARLVLRRASKLDAPAAQTPHPYTGKTSISTADAIARLQTLNEILKPANANDRKEYQYADQQVCKVDLKMRNIVSSIEEEMRKMAQETEEENTFNHDYKTILPRGSYNSYLQLKNDSSTVVGNIPASLVKSTAFSYNAEANTYTVRVNFKNTSITPNDSADSQLRQVFSDVITVEDLKSATGAASGDDDFQMTLEATIDKVKYTVKDDISNAYVEYTFNAVTNLPVSAEYSYSSTLYVPATLIKIGIAESSFVMITMQTLKMNYLFSF